MKLTLLLFKQQVEKNDFFSTDELAENDDNINNIPVDFLHMN